MKYFLNTAKNLSSEKYSFFRNDDVHSFHESLEKYEPTPLLSLPDVSDILGIKELLVKDESKRFGLNAFKGLGASYAIYKYLQKHERKPVFCTATDGNHGRAVAWAARLFRCGSIIFVPKHTVQERIHNIEKEGAKVVVVDGDYDKTVKTAYSEAEKNGLSVIQDTAWEGYTQIPELIMAGYTTMFREVDSVLNTASPVDAVFLQVGVGSWAAAAVWYFHVRYGKDRPKIICIEPEHADCLLRSLENDRITSIDTQDTIMAGLNCGTPSYSAWDILITGIDMALSISDEYTMKAMQLLYHADNLVISGESGAAGLGGLIALSEYSGFANAKREIGIGEQSRVLVFNTEGDTDSKSYRKIVKGLQHVT